MKPARQRTRRPAAQRKQASAPQPTGAVLLATVVAEAATGWRVRMGAREQVLPLDASVDPALMRAYRWDEAAGHYPCGSPAAPQLRGRRSTSPSV